jgi:hypothetical protein
MTRGHVSLVRNLIGLKDDIFIYTYILYITEYAVVGGTNELFFLT